MTDELARIDAEAAEWARRMDHPRRVSVGAAVYREACARLIRERDEALERWADDEDEIIRLMDVVEDQYRRIRKLEEALEWLVNLAHDVLGRAGGSAGASTREGEGAAELVGGDLNPAEPNTVAYGPTMRLSQFCEANSAPCRLKSYCPECDIELPIDLSSCLACNAGQRYQEVER